MCVRAKMYRDKNNERFSEADFFLMEFLFTNVKYFRLDFYHGVRIM